MIAHENLFIHTSLEPMIHDMLLYIAQNIKETNPAVKLSHQQTTRLGIADEESGLGWFIEATVRGIQIEKGGNSPRHSSECVFIREKNIGIICFTTMQGEDLGNLSESVLDKVMAAK
jgi:D-alanyl-D-alanine-carboxypeptidase/D-alanyl-D-alanine-endopeptidase